MRRFQDRTVGDLGWKEKVWNGNQEADLAQQTVLFYVAAIFKTIPLTGKWNRLPSHLSGMAARLQALWAKGWSSYNSPLGVTTACLQTLPKTPNPRKCTLNLHRCFYFRWRRRHTNLFWPEMLKLAADLAAVCSRAPKKDYKWRKQTVGSKWEWAETAGETISVSHRRVNVPEGALAFGVLCGRHQQQRVAVVQPSARLTFPSLRPLSLQQAISERGIFRYAVRSK